MIGSDAEYFVDTNVLIDTTNAARKTHRAAIKLLREHPKLVMSAQVAREYLVVSTRPKGRNGLGLDPSIAKENLASLRRAIRLLPEKKTASSNAVATF